MTKYRVVLTVCLAFLLALAATSVEAGWGRYRVTTYYAPAPVVRQTTVVRSAYRPLYAAPVVVAPAPVVISPAPVTAYYSSPSLYVGPRGNVRAAYYAPVRTYYSSPAPVTYFYQDLAPGTVILP